MTTSKPTPDYTLAPTSSDCFWATVLRSYDSWRRDCFARRSPKCMRYPDIPPSG
jgi:hypothetical protein